jgi:hypothetical protein
MLRWLPLTQYLLPCLDLAWWPSCRSTQRRRLLRTSNLNRPGCQSHLGKKNISGLTTPEFSACQPYCQSTHSVPTDDDLSKVFAPRKPRTTSFVFPYFQNCDVRKQRSFKLRPATYISTYASSLTLNLSLLLNRSPSQPTNFREQRKPHWISDVVPQLSSQSCSIIWHQARGPDPWKNHQRYGSMSAIPFFDRSEPNSGGSVRQV